jgi:anti-anti-sigma regulatory factor
MIVGLVSPFSSLVASRETLPVLLAEDAGAAVVLPRDRTVKFYLIVAVGKKKGYPIPITVDLFLMGTEKMCQLRSQMAGVGGKHCALVRHEKKIFLRDLHSGEPTILNGSAIPPGEEWACHAGDRINVGPLEFVLQFREKPLSQRDLEEWALKCLDKDSEQHIYEDEDFRGVRQRNDTPAQAAASILENLQAKRGFIRGRLRVGRDGNVTHIRFNDRYLVDEAEIALVKKELYDNLDRNNLRILLDFKNVTRMSTAAVKMIDELLTWLKPWGSTLAVCRVRAELQDILPRLNLDNTIPNFRDKRAALAARW